MASLGSREFNLGWIPSDDDTRGRSNGLIRMDNLNLDENGNVSLTKGTLKQSALFPATPFTLFSATMNGVKHRYAGLNNGTILKDTNGAKTFGTTVLTNGGEKHAYGEFLGDTIICAKDQRKRDNGTFIRNLDVEKPSAAPGIDVSEKYSLSVIPDRSVFTVEEGTAGVLDPAAATVESDSTTFRTVVKIDSSKDLTAIKNGVTDTDGLNDKFTLWFKPEDSTRVKIVRLEFLLDPEGSSTDPADNYFYYEWNFQFNPDLKNKGIDKWSGLEVERQQFSRIGPDTERGWKDVQQVRIIIENSNTQDNSFGELNIEGGRGSLNGTYRYLQVNVYNNGRYDSISPISEISGKTVVDHQFTKITPVAPNSMNVTGAVDEVNKIYIYRQNIDLGGFYLVAIRNDAGTFIDEVDDTTAIERIDGADIFNHTPDLFAAAVPDDVIDMVTNYYSRVIYITVDKIYPSRVNDPGVIDSGLVLDVSSDKNELNLFITKVGSSSLAIGTTVDIYDLTGTGAKFPDGTIDFILRPGGTGISQRPISDANAVYNGTLVYMSSSGWRVRAGTSNESLLGETRLLYEDETRYGIEPVFRGSDNLANYSCTVSDNKLFASVTLSSGVTRRVYVFDFIKKYWYPYFINPVDLFTEEDDTLLGIFGDSGDEYLRELNVGSILDSDGIFQQVHLRTAYLDGNQPNNRKDLSVLKIYADTGDDLVEIFGSPNGDQTFISLGQFRFNGPTVLNINVQDTPLDLCKSIALKITDVNGAGVSQFKFYYWELVYEPRPEQVNYLRVPPTNFGIAGRKRFYDLPFSLDTLGNTFTVEAKLDGVSVQTETFPGSTLGKEFFTIAFRNEIIGHELGITIQAADNGVFEFYELLNPRNTEQIPDLGRFYHIPYTNLGTPARKRFVRIALVIDTRGKDVTYTPLVDAVSLPPLTINTNRKETVIYYVTTETTGIDLGGTIDSDTDTPFEFYGFDSDETVTEVLPPTSKFIFACTDFGTAARKRFSRISFVCDPRGGTVQFRPRLDGIFEPYKSFSGNRKQTFSYYFTTDKIFVDLCYEIKSDTPFEFFQLLKPERLETLPEPVKFFRIPRTNLNTDARKRFYAFAFFLNTQGHSVRFTPYIDGVAQSETSVFNTSTESTVIHYFNSETVGHDIGGNLETVNGESALPFEFYGINFDQTISEKLPGPATHLVLPPENFGVAGKKRIRTIPLIINTREADVTFTPTVDGTSFPSQTFNTTEKRTVLYYFESDSFGIDYGGVLDSIDNTKPFEFYGLGQPENVQTLPVAKKFDQVTITEFDRRYWLRRFRLRCVATGTAITWRVFDKDVQLDSGTIATTPDRDIDYDVSMVKGIQGSVLRVEFQSSQPFHRYWLDAWIKQSGGDTELQKLRL